MNEAAGAARAAEAEKSFLRKRYVSSAPQKLKADYKENPEGLRAGSLRIAVKYFPEE